MASGFTVAGVDLDSIFAPWHSGWAQASVTEFEIAGYGDINQRYATLATGSAAAATSFKVSSGADLNTIFAAYGSTGVRVASQPSAVSGSSAAGTPSGTVTSGTTSCAGTKGGGTYTYTWHIASGSGVSFTNPNGATTAVTGSVNAATTNSGGMYCTISDGVTSVNTNTETWSLQNTSPAFTSAQHVYTSSSGTEIVPAGAANVVIEVWGPGGTGAFGTGSVGAHDAAYGAGGAAGGYCRSSYSCSGGKTLGYSVGTTNGSQSTVTSGTLSISAMTANGASTQGSLGGGTASGGTIANVKGAGGANGGPAFADGAAGLGTAGIYEGVEGSGGRGGFQSGNPGATGSTGIISFRYT